MEIFAAPGSNPQIGIGAPDETGHVWEIGRSHAP